jgi:hypothetical protein
MLRVGRDEPVLLTSACFLKGEERVDTPTSEVARLRQHIQAEYEAAERGLSGLASGITRHAFITARTEHLAALHEQLTDLVGREQATHILAQTIWTPQDWESTTR